MTSKELLAEYRRCGRQSLSVTLHFIADRVHQLRLAHGSRLNDAIDFAAALREIAEAAKLHDPAVEALTETMCSADIGKAPFFRDRRPVDDTCPRCGHIHQGDAECGEPARRRPDLPM